MKLEEIITIQEFERQVNEEWEADVLLEMADIHSDIHGIKNVVIWVGRAPANHWLRVKVSNVPNHWADDNFVIRLDHYDYDPKKVAPWVKKYIPDIIDWLKLNHQLIHDFELSKHDNTKVWLNTLSKLPNPKYHG